MKKYIIPLVINDKPCPCIDCLCLASCRLKSYAEMKHQCSIIKDYQKFLISLKSHVHFDHHACYRLRIYHAQNPIRWKVNNLGMFMRNLV